MRFVVDMNLTPRWAEFLNSAGYEASHWSLIGDATASDHEICAWARGHRRVVLTNDLDFPRILAHTNETGPSVILLRGEPLVPESRGNALLLAVAQCGQDLIGGAILSLDWSGPPRARVLPLS